MVVDLFLVPLKSFGSAKGRLRADPTLDVPAIAASMARDVILACAPVRVVVVTESAAVASFARELGAGVSWSEAPGLNEALEIAYRRVAAHDTTVAIAVGDLRRPERLGAFEPADGLTVVTDQHGLGTNLLALPCGLDFRFAFGPGSARRHLDEGRRLGLAVHLVSRGPWCVDVDRPEDLEGAQT